MKKIDLGQTITILANVGVIAGIVFLGIELQQNNELLEVQAEMAMSDVRANTILADVIAQPELIELMLKDEQSLTEVERYRRLAMGLRVLRNWQGRHRLVQRGLLNPAEIGQDMSNTYHRAALNYGVPEAWENYRGVFPSDFVEFFEENVVNER